MRSTWLAAAFVLTSFGPAFGQVYVPISVTGYSQDVIADATGTYVEPLACVLRGAERLPAGRVLVVGQGFIGRLFVAVLRRRGDDVYAIDSNPARAGRAP